MTTEPMRFNDGAGYETMMGIWSRKVGEKFLDWLRPATGQTWLDVGCGNGAFTELVVERCAPAAITGIDPSDAQLAFARKRSDGGIARYLEASAMDLPVADGAVDVAVSALVIFFMPDPARGVREMARVTRPGGTVCTYAWDLVGGGFPYAALSEARAEAGVPQTFPPHPEAADLDELSRLWTAAGLADVATSVITVERTFDGIEDYIRTATTGTSAATLAAMPEDVRAHVLASAAARLPADADGRITVTARAHAVMGRVVAG